jgi:hypothetical protein
VEFQKYSAAGRNKSVRRARKILACTEAIAGCIRRLLRTSESLEGASDQWESQITLFAARRLNS